MYLSWPMNALNKFRLQGQGHRAECCCDACGPIRRWVPSCGATQARHCEETVCERTAVQGFEAPGINGVIGAGPERENRMTVRPGESPISGSFHAKTSCGVHRPGDSCGSDSPWDVAAALA